MGKLNRNQPRLSPCDGPNPWAEIINTTDAPLAISDFLDWALGRKEIASDLTHALQDPHAAGWYLQASREEARSGSFQRHTREQEKHSSVLAATQIFTPRWIADYLTWHGLKDFGPNDEVLDPACGGGQMLVAAFEVLKERFSPAAALGQIRGCDLDPEAVLATRAALVTVARRQGVDPDDALDIVQGTITIADALQSDLKPAHLVVTNPPYMGSRAMPPDLLEKVKSFRPFHHDLATAFLARMMPLASRRLAILSQQSFFFLSRFAPARTALFHRFELEVFAHLGAGCFPALRGEKANVVAFVLRTEKSNTPTAFLDLRNLDTSEEKRRAIQDPEYVRYRRLDDFGAIPGAPLAHWVRTSELKIFERGQPLSDLAEIPGALKTGANRRFIRDWRAVNPEELRDSGIRRGSPDGRWVFISKGGPHRKWWGNWYWAVDFGHDARQFYATNKTSQLIDKAFWFRPGIVYTDFGGQRFNARLMPEGCLFDMTGPAIFVRDRQTTSELALLALLNAHASSRLLNAMNPTLHYQVRDVRNLPIWRWDDLREELCAISLESVEDARLVERCDPRSPSAGEGATGHEKALSRIVERQKVIDQIVDKIWDL